MTSKGLYMLPAWLLGASLAFAPSFALADDDDPPEAGGEEEGDKEGDEEGDKEGDEKGDEEVDRILKEETDANQSTKEETQDLKEGRVDERVGVKKNDILAEEETGRRKVAIKTLQKKNFLKIGRSEVGPYLGFVTNDPFINRYLIGANYTYHFTEVLGGEVGGTFSPDFGTGDWKAVTEQLVNKNKVSPDISKIIWYATGSLTFSPIYGKIAALNRKIIIFDLYGVFGLGAVGTVDDLRALQKEGDPDAEATKSQVHPTTNFGGGFRVVFSRNFAARLEGRSLIYIENISSVTLEMKNNFMLQLGVSFFFPGMK